MMNKEQLQSYCEGLISELKTEELALQRVKLTVQNKKKMIDLVQDQIAHYDSSESAVEVLKEVTEGIK